MATYITLFSWTDQGIRGVKDTVKRAAKFNQAIKKAGGKVKDVYWTMGRYDGMILFEAPDDETATALMIGGGAQGNVRTETLRAFDERGMKKILAKARR
ncbi:MAG: GYD domain-containing protein [Nitrospiraceae bacterium]